MKSDWSFARKPFWLFSHVFVVVCVIAFLNFSSWQWTRHQDQADVNAAIEARSAQQAVDVETLLAKNIKEVEYRAVWATGEYVEDRLVDVGNRSQAGVAGYWVVGLFRLSGGELILVNRGFVPDHSSAVPEPAPRDTTTLDGWIRLSAEKGVLGPVDTGEGSLVPRLDIEAIGQRVDGDLAPFWFQVRPPTETRLANYPDPVALPELHPGPHLGYVGQWIIFSVMTAGVYVVMLNRKARPTMAADIPTTIDESSTPLSQN